MRRAAKVQFVGNFGNVHFVVNQQFLHFFDSVRE